ncbi:sensor histidine kinase [Crossiella cryophila]|uniref:histidine kinase n=1 Tax=Crossiella cryophila TaxID=43355 RepID=A0A7W7FXK3_9PSEU|nr:HAMP domain-containing sensor histidine kinase [Crossiella cryophila]MBB4680738.1 signal transduction histidine kinase [Crossiella cryophila]
MRRLSSMRARLTLLVVAVVALPVLTLAALLPGLIRDQLLTQARQRAEHAVSGGECAGHLAGIADPQGNLPETLQYTKSCAGFGENVEFAVPAGPPRTVRLNPGPDRLLTLWPFADQPESRLIRVLPGNRYTPLPPGEHLSLEWAQRILDRWTLGLLAGVPLLLALAGWLTWLALGRMLRPVARIRAELADITATDLGRRVPEPARQDEIHQLARTVNATLTRLDQAVIAQRRFVADAAHELRGPIAALRGELELATTHPGQADWPEVVRLALTDTVRLQDLAADLLLLAQLDNPGPATGAEIDLGNLIGEHLAARELPAHLQRSAQLPKLPVVVPGRAAALTRLLGNLLDNAERHADRYVEVRLGTEDGHAVLEVLDDGPGIPLMDRGRIFEPFARLDDARARADGGTGLGLAIARQIAEHHGGRIWAGRGPGARFRVQLPLARQDTPLPAATVFRG